MKGLATNEGREDMMGISKKKIVLVCALAGLSYSVIPTIICRGRNYLAFRLERKPLQKEKYRKPKNVKQEYRNQKYKKIEAGEKNIYLTFDDGPGCYTEEILAVLRYHHVKAAFFMVSDFAKAHPEIVRSVRREGHSIGMHSRGHKNPMFEGPLRSYRDLQQGYMDMQGLGVPVKMFRPPWGIVNASVLLWQKQHGLDMYLWNVMTEDWRGDETAKSIADKLIKRITSGCIICLHDGRGKDGAPLRTAKALKLAIPRLKAEGYQFVCLGKEE